MRPKMLLIDEPCKMAKDILREVYYLPFSTESSEYDAIWTGLTPVETYLPVFCPCTGIDHVDSPEIIHLDNDWKRNEGTQITSTAEHTWSLILQLAKSRRMQLSGKTIGIIGLGRIGDKIRKYGHSFDMNVNAYDINLDHIRDIMTTFEKVLKKSDIITLHVPLNESTKGMINKREFDMMKHGTLLINTSRAEIVDKFSLIDNLYSGKLGGYADDFSNYWHINHDNVIQTPHIGGNCIEAREMTDIYIAKKAVEYWRSKNP